MVAQCAHQADDALWNRPGGFGEIVGDVLAGLFGVLVESAARAHELAGIGQAL